MLKAVIFDLNGVFVQGPTLSSRLREEYGVPEETFVPILKEVMNIVRRPGISDSFTIWKPRFWTIGLNISKDTFFHFWFSGENVIPEVVNLAREVKNKGLKVFILSNNFAERTNYYRQNFPEIFNTVDKSYFSWETGYVKPEKQAYTLLLKENGLKPEECLYFDDSENNLAAARQLGIAAKKFTGIAETKSEIEKFLNPQPTSPEKVA